MNKNNIETINPNDIDPKIRKYIDSKFMWIDSKIMFLTSDLSDLNNRLNSLTSNFNNLQGTLNSLTSSINNITSQVQSMFDIKINQLGIDQFKMNTNSRFNNLDTKIDNNHNYIKEQFKKIIR